MKNKNKPVRFQLDYDRRRHAVGTYDENEVRFDYMLTVTLTKPFKVGSLKYRKGEQMLIALGDVLATYNEETKKWEGNCWKELYRAEA